MDVPQLVKYWLTRLNYLRQQGRGDRSVCHSVNRITDERGNGRRPNLAGMGKG